MCNMAAYAGSRPAAPELIALLQAQETLAGGHFTGIATIHEGKIYMAKVCGDCKRLLETTDVLHLPGTIGIAHSRTPGIPLDSWAQPFMTSDEKNVFCSNGIGPCNVLPANPKTIHEITDQIFEAGFKLQTGVPDTLPSYIRLKDGLTYHDSEIESAYIGLCNRSMSLRESLRKCFQNLPTQTTSLALSVREPDHAAAIRYNQSLFYGRKNGDAVLATSGTALQDLHYPYIAPVPPASLVELRPEGLVVNPLDVLTEKLNVTPDLHAIWKFLDEFLADGTPYSVIELCDELAKHPEFDPPGISAQDSFAVYSYLMEQLRRNSIKRTYREVPASRKDTMRKEAVFRIN